MLNIKLLYCYYINEGVAKRGLLRGEVDFLYTTKLRTISF